MRGQSETECQSSDESSSGDEVSLSRVRRRRVPKRRANVSCDTCGARTLNLFYRCSKCPLRPEMGAFDICGSCFKLGKWCFTRDHPLIKTTVDSKGRARKRGTVSLIRCKRGLLTLVEKLDSTTGEFVPIFRSPPKERVPDLFDSPAVFHNTRPLMAMPAGYGQILLADLEHNACSTWTHIPRWLTCEWLDAHPG